MLTYFLPLGNPTIIGICKCNHTKEEICRISTQGKYAQMKQTHQNLWMCNHRPFRGYSSFQDILRSYRNHQIQIAQKTVKM